MAKSFACRDIGIACGFKARAETRKELMEKISEHAKKAHNMRQMDDQTMSKVEAAIKEV
jgi:predicted small metal-binding protein